LLPQLASTIKIIIKKNCQKVFKKFVNNVSQKFVNNLPLLLRLSGEEEDEE
jgi:hypothetical protein